MLEDSSRRASSVGPWGRRQWRSHQIIVKVIIQVIIIIVAAVVVLVLLLLVVVFNNVFVLF